MIRVAIVDDESEPRNMLEECCNRFFRERGIDFECVVFESCLDFVSDYALPFHIVFMDIDMPHMDGLSAAKRLRALDEFVVIVFVTRMAQCAVRGYEVDALDFIIKPVSPFKLAAVLEKALHKLPSGKVVTIQSERSTIILAVSDILYVEGNNQYVIYHVKRNGKYCDYKVHASLKATVESLSPGFSRCSNSFIVNLANVLKVEPSEVQIDTASIPISRTYRKQFLTDLNRYFAGV